jgi:hypothetical protein
MNGHIMDRQLMIAVLSTLLQPLAMPAYPLLDAQLGQKAKSRQKFNQTNCEID